MTFDNWIQSGKDLVVKGTGHQFAIADWLLEGGERWEEKAYAKAEEITGFTRQTLYDYVSTARAFPPESRKYASASFNHYRAVAPVADPEKRHYFMVQAVACTVAELRRKVSPPLASKQKSEREVKGDKPITVIVSGFERSVLADLATLRGVDISAIVRPLITGYVEKSDINTEWLRGGKQLKQKREEKLQARREKWAKATHESIQNLIEEYDQREGPFPLPIDFVHGWQNRTGRRFTARVFNFAMEHTELGHHCGTKNRGAYGLPVASGRKSCGKGRKYVPTT